MSCRLSCLIAYVSELGALKKESDDTTIVVVSSLTFLGGPSSKKVSDETTTIVVSSLTLQELVARIMHMKLCMKILNCRITL
jgi:hypothetical protein